MRTEPMSQAIIPELTEISIPNLDDIIIEDDTPVDNLISEKQQRFLVHCLYSSLRRDNPFLAAANVGLFYAIKQPPLVPDVMLSFEVSVPEDWSQKQNRSYFVWNFGKVPEVAIEIVSNTVGGELSNKLTDYARARIPYYVVFDPLQYLKAEIVQVYELGVIRYHLRPDRWMEEIGLGLTLWEGTFEGKAYTWLRWCDREGTLLLTGDERAEQEHQRAERLAELLRAQGINPDA
jgi:Uma2 family endonuclease